MSKSSPTYDVFISHTRGDSALVDEITRVLHSHDLTVFTHTEEVATGSKIENTLWEAIAESKALIAIIPEVELSAWIAFELGAAKAWNKPIYAIAANPASARLPVELKGVAFYTPSRVDEIAREIKRRFEPLSVEERDVLIDEYHRIGVSVDALMLSPGRLARLANQFRRRTKRQMPPEELLRVLLRLRKQTMLERRRRRKAQ